MLIRNSCYAFLLLVAICLPAGSQQPVPPLPPGQERPQHDPAQERLERERAKRLNIARHQELKRDTDRLLQLSQELKKYVDESSENTLSVNVIEKAEEIEKLAKRVRSKMRGW